MPRTLCIAGKGQIELASLFGDFHKYTEPCFNRVWSVRPSQVVHIANLKLQDIPEVGAFTRTVRDEKLLMSVAESSMAARSLRIPFVLVVPGWGDTPSTPGGMAALLAEDVAQGDPQIIVRVNGLFGPQVENRVSRMVLSDNPTVDDQKVINPVSARSLVKDIADLIYWETSAHYVVRVGDEPGTWYDHFAKVHPNVRPWADHTRKAQHEREMNWEYDGRDDYWIPYRPSELELRQWLIEVGHNLLP